jgi:hypothetical protein
MPIAQRIAIPSRRVPQNLERGKAFASLIRKLDATIPKRWVPARATPSTMARRCRLIVKEFCVSMWVKMIKDDGKSEVRKGLTAKDHKGLKVFISVFTCCRAEILPQRR